MSDILLTDAVVLTMDPARTAYSNGYVWIRNDRIQEVGAMPAPATLPAGTAIRSMNKRHLVMPGLINAHNHISNNVVRGTFDEGSREDYGTRMFAALRALDGDASYAGALSSLVEQLCGGITTTQAGEFGHVDRPAGVLRAIHDAGLRAVFSLAVMDSAGRDSRLANGTAGVPRGAFKGRHSPRGSGAPVRFDPGNRCPRGPLADEMHTGDDPDATCLLRRAWRAPVHARGRGQGRDG